MSPTDNNTELRVLHVITGLGVGGAEMMLYKLLSQIDRQQFSPSVISLMDIGPVGEKIQQLGIPVTGLRLGRRLSAPLALAGLAGRIRALAPHVVQTWMYHADLLGGVSARLAGVKSVAWNIRNSTLDPNTSKKTTIGIMRCCAAISRRVPARIVCCSKSAADLHRTLGYAAEKMQVIPNGFDLTAFRPDEEARRAVRQELEIPSDAPLIGLIGRHDPQKDHNGFIEAARLLSASLPEAYYVMCGDRVTWGNVELSAAIDRAGLRGRFRMTGRRHDIPRINAALDVAASSSAYGEAFSNTLGEAMACGVPCVATDVGDAAFIIGDTGSVVPPRDPRALADAINSLLNTSEGERRTLSACARSRVEAEFSLPRVAARYEALYREMAKCAA